MVLCMLSFVSHLVCLNIKFYVACKCVCIYVRKGELRSRCKDVWLLNSLPICGEIPGRYKKPCTVEERDLHALGPRTLLYTIVGCSTVYCSILFTLMRCTGLSGCDFLHTSAVSVLLMNFHPSSSLLDCSSCKMRSRSKMTRSHVSTF